MLPRFEDRRHLTCDHRARIVPIDTLGKKLVVAGVHMPNMGGNGELHRLPCEHLCGRRTAHPTAVLQARVLGDLPLGPLRGTGKDLANTGREPLHVLAIKRGAALGLTNGQSVSNLPEAFTQLGSGRILG